jgi:hypothetical protein
MPTDLVNVLTLSSDVCTIDVSCSLPSYWKAKVVFCTLFTIHIEHLPLAVGARGIAGIEISVIGPLRNRFVEHAIEQVVGIVITPLAAGGMREVDDIIDGGYSSTTVTGTQSIPSPPKSANMMRNRSVQKNSISEICETNTSQLLGTDRRRIASLYERDSEREYVRVTSYENAPQSEQNCTF